MSENIFKILFGSQTPGNTGTNKGRGSASPAQMMPQAEPVKTPPSSYMDPKWQNPTAKFDPVTKNIVQKPSNPDPLNWKGIAAQMAASNPVGGAGTGSGAQAVPAVNPASAFPDPRTNLNPLYDAAAKRMMELNTGLTGDFDAGIAAIKNNYRSTGQDQYDRYQGARADLDASAQGLNINPNEIYKGYDSSLRRIQENADLQRNASVDFMEKLKVLRGQQFTDMQASLEQQRAKALADQTAQWVDAISAMQQNALAGSSGGGGGGGGRRSGGGGGSSSSGSATETAKMDEKLYSVGDIEAYNELLASGDEEGAAAYLSFLQQSTGSPASKFAASEVARLKSTPITRTVPRTTSATGSFYKNAVNNAYRTNAAKKDTAAEKERQKKIAAAAAAAAAFMKNSGIFGNPVVSTNVNSSSKRKTPGN